MTETTILRGRQVTDRLAHGGNVIMAGGTVIHDPGMIKHTRRKTTDAMTDRTILRGGNMRRRLA
jgi:hypothetical protein